MRRSTTIRRLIVALAVIAASVGVAVSPSPVAGQTGGGTATPPVINEFSYNTSGTDVEYFEILGDPSTDYSAYSILEVQAIIEGSDAPGDVIDVFAVGTTDANGINLVELAADTIENDPINFLLVEGFTGAIGDDLDTDDDGTLDSAPWTSLADDVSVLYSGSVAYSTTVLDEFFDDARVTTTFAPGGASRIPDGADTDTEADWYRNDFSLAGIPGEIGGAEPGESLNTPGRANEAIVETIIITEIMQNPGTPISDSDGEWFEIYNYGSADVDIEGWTITDNGTNSHTIASGGPLLVPAGSYVVLGRSGDTGVNGGITMFYVFGSDIAIGNSDDELILTTGGGDEVDRVEWDGGPDFPDPNGASMALEEIFSDNNVGANWCESSVTAYATDNFGTPGAVNDCQVATGITLISAIQGDVPAPNPDTPTPFPAAGDPADDSPLLGTEVTIEGIVTGHDNLAGQSNGGGIFHNDRGFFVQEEEADYDGDANTSEGIFVQFDDASDDIATYPIGTKVQVTGDVAEHFEFTVIGNVSSIVNLGPDTVPSAVVIPATVDRNGWEAVEGQLVTVAEAVANSGGTNRFNELILTPGPTKDILIRPETSAGLFGLQADAGAGNPAIPRKPAAPSTTVVKADLFDTVQNATGPVAYSFDLYKLMIQPGALPTIVDDPTIVYPFAGVAPAASDEIRVTALNVENFFPVGIVHDGAATTTIEFNNKRDRIANAVVDLLESPDIVGVEEVYDLASLQAVAAAIPGAGGTAYTAHLIEGNDNRGIDVGFLTKDATVTVNSVTQLGKNEPDPTTDNCGDIAGLLFDRPPLAIDVTVKGVDMVVINNHFSSKAAPDTCRDAQADFVRAQVVLLEAAGDEVIVTGDINAFEDETPFTNFLEDGSTSLDNLWDTVPTDEAYSFQFSGVLQTLDHMLITDGLALLNPQLVYAHFDTAYYSRQLDEASFATSFTDGHKVSDHDPPVLTLTVPTPATCMGLPVTVDIGAGDSPTAGDDVILGTVGNDVIDALAGNDVICGLGGADDIRGGDGNDTIYGDDGDDQLRGGDGDDTIDGGIGADFILGNAGADTINGQQGADTAFGGSGQDIIDGGPGNDRLGGGSEADTVTGGDGNDNVAGGSGNDNALTGGPGTDTINAGSGDDLVINGNGGNDVVSGNGGNDVVNGDGGNDIVRGGNGDDQVNGGPGDDQLFGNPGIDTCDGGPDTDVAATNCETLLNVP